MHSSRATSSAANAAENGGDDFLTTGSGRAIELSRLLRLPGMARLDNELQADVCDMLGYAFVQMWVLGYTLQKFLDCGKSMLSHLG